MKDKELYESFLTNIFNSRRWDVWISLAVICHVEYTLWVSYPISPISNKYVSHQEQCVVIIIANGWPADGMDISHYAALVRIDEDKKQISMQIKKEKNYYEELQKSKQSKVQCT